MSESTIFPRTEMEALAAALDNQYATGHARTPAAQEWLDNAQEIRATKRPQDPEWPTLTFVDAMSAAASMLDDSAPTTAERLRRSVNYLLNVTAKLERLTTRELAWRMSAEFRRSIGVEYGQSHVEILRGQFVFASQRETPNRGPYLTIDDYVILDDALRLLSFLDQDAQPLPGKAVEAEIHGLCPGHPIKEGPSATCSVCNMSRATLERLAFLDLTGRREWAELTRYRATPTTSAKGPGETGEKT